MTLLQFLDKHWQEVASLLILVFVVGGLDILDAIADRIRKGRK